MSFQKRFYDKSKKFRNNKRKKSVTRNQKTNLIQSVKKTVVNLTTNNVKQMKRILLKMIDMLKKNTKKKIENQSKLSLTLNQIENKILNIEKQNVNQLIKAKTYVSVMKTATKIIKTKNESEHIVKKAATANMITTKKKKKNDDTNRKEENEITNNIRY